MQGEFPKGLTLGNESLRLVGEEFQIAKNMILDGIVNDDHVSCIEIYKNGMRRAGKKSLL